jgi:hypothetical protein
MLTISNAKIEVEQAYTPDYLNYFIYLRAMELVHFMYNSGGGLSTIFRYNPKTISYETNSLIIMEWSVRSDKFHKVLSLYLNDEGKFFIKMYAHSLGENHQIIKDDYLNGENCLKTLKSCISYMNE